MDKPRYPEVAQTITPEANRKQPHFADMCVIVSGMEHEDSGAGTTTEPPALATEEVSSPPDGYEAVRASYPPILNTSQVAELLDLNPRTILNMAGDGRLPASRLPGSRKFHFLLEDIIATLKEHRIVA